MKAIVNVNEAWGIGTNGDLLCFLPDDMRFFRETTKGKTVIMGRRTLESFPGAAPLPGRNNLVLTHEIERIPQTAFAKAAADRASGKKTALHAFSAPEELFSYLAEEKAKGSLTEEDLYVIGGAAIYKLLLPHCDTCLVTINDCKANADTYFPNLRADADWQEISESELHVQNGISFHFTSWKRKAHSHLA